MASATQPFHHCLEKNPFYNEQDYLKRTSAELGQKNLVPVVSYTWNTQPRIVRLIKEVVSYVFLFLYHIFHILAGRLIVPSSMLYGENQYARASNLTLNNTDWKYKRITLQVDGIKIDAMIIGKKNTLSNRRWLLYTNGNGEFFEINVGRGRVTEIISEIGANALVWNYPGSGASEGISKRASLEKAYKLVLRFLEDPDGIGADEIIGYGNSLGGGVQASALKSYKLNPTRKYVFVYSRTFKNLGSVVGWLSCRPLSIFVSIFGWNFDTISAVKKIKVPQIILQTAEVENYTFLRSSERIKHDDVIHPEASLAKALMDDKNWDKDNKVVIGIKDMHNDHFSEARVLGEKINIALKSKSAQAS